ncbi:MAG: glycosyltransferase [Flavobacteriaceae bacterium]|nr:glycosyltransferase [Flavobacteriaceae bacterium]
MNIAIIIIHVFDPEAGGVQRITNNISEIFASMGHNVCILSYSTKNVDYSNNTIPVLTIKNQTELKKILFDKNIQVVINQEGYCRRFTKLMLKNKDPETSIINNLHINPLNFHDNYQQFIGSFLKRHHLGFLNNVAVQKTLLQYHIFKQRYDLNYIIKNTNAFVMLSERFKPELYFLAPALKKYSHKIHGIGNPFNRTKINIMSLEKDDVILFVGRLNILQKRVDLLLEIWKDLHQKLPEWKFWIVGEGEDQYFMENYCKENNLNRVTFFGKDNPNEFYKKAKIFHMTSAFEGFGNVLVEAQSYGCVPVLFNSYAAAQDIITHNENGMLVPPFNSNEYVQTTTALINNPEKLSQMALNGYENVNRFSYEETYKKWEEVFNSLK